MELVLVMASLIIMIMVFSVFCLGVFAILYKKHEEVQEVVKVKATPNKFDTDESVPLDQFTPNFSKPINFKINQYEQEN